MRKEIEIKVTTPEGNSETFLTYPGNDLASALELAGWKIASGLEEKELQEAQKIKVSGEHLKISVRERKQLSPEELKQGIRRADLCRVETPLQVTLNAYYRKNHLWDTIEWEKWAETLPWETVNVYLPGRQMNLPGALQETQQALYDRIVAALKDYQILLNPQELRDLAFLDRIGRPVIELKALVHKQRQEVYTLDRKAHPMVGVIVSLEAETLSLLLVDLNSGQKMDQHTEPSIVFQKLSEEAQRRNKPRKGAVPDLFKELHTSLREQLQRMSQELLKKQGNVRPQDIYRTVVMGQTTLLHVLLDVPPVDISTPGLHSLFYREMKLCPQGQVPQMNPWGEYIVLQQWGHMVGSDALNACLALYGDHSDPVLIVQPGMEGQVTLQIGKKFWVTESFPHVPEVSLLQTSVGKLLAAAGIRMEDVQKAYVSVGLSQELGAVKEKIAAALSRIPVEKVEYVVAPYWIGAQAALLSEIARKRMQEIQKNSLFVM